MNHDPSPGEVARAVKRLTDRARQSCERRLYWDGSDRMAAHTLATFVALVTNQARGASQ